MVGTLWFERDYDKMKESKMIYCDVNAMVGAHFAPREGRFFGVNDLIEEMDFFGIDEVLVYHKMTGEYNLNLGN